MLRIIMNQAKNMNEAYVASHSCTFSPEVGKTESPKDVCIK